MRQKSEMRATPEKIMKDIRRATRKHHSAEEKIRVVLEGFRGEYSIAELCRREGNIKPRCARSSHRSRARRSQVI